MKLKRFYLMLFIGLSAAAGGCHSTIVPLKPAAIGPPWALHQPTEPSTTSIASRPPDTATARITHREKSPAVHIGWFANTQNGTTGQIDLTSYHNVWRHTIHLLINMGYHIQWASYRLGVITTRYRTGPEILQWWRPDATTFPELMEGTINTFRRIVRVVITRTPQAHSFAVTVEVLVQRRENPAGTVGSVAFFGASAFGASPLPLQARHAITAANKPYWMRVGHDPALELKILHRLFHKL